MLADLSLQDGVILFLNTSLSGADQRAPNAIFDALWTYGESVRAGLN